MGIIGGKKIGMGFLKALILSRKDGRRITRHRWLNNYYMHIKNPSHTVKSITLKDLFAKDWVFISDYYEDEPLIAAANKK